MIPGIVSSSRKKRLPEVVLVDKSLVAAPDVFLLSGYSATLRRSAVLSAAAGSFALTGAAASIVKNQIIVQAEAGAYILTGTAATLQLQQWAASFSQTLNLDSSGWGGFNLRQAIPAALSSLSGTKIRVTLASSSAGAAVIDGIRIGEKAATGNVWDFEPGTRAQLLVGGSGSFTVPSNSSVFTDPLTFNYNESKSYVIAVHFSTTSAVRGRNSVSGADNYFKSASDESNSDAPTGYSTTAGGLRLVATIDVMP